MTDPNQADASAPRERVLDVLKHVHAIPTTAAVGALERIASTLEHEAPEDPDATLWAYRARIAAAQRLLRDDEPAQAVWRAELLCITPSAEASSDTVESALWARRVLAESQLRLGRHGDARRTWREAIATLPGHMPDATKRARQADCLCALAACYEAGGAAGAARRCYRVLLDHFAKRDATECEAALALAQAKLAQHEATTGHPDRASAALEALDARLGPATDAYALDAVAEAMRAISAAHVAAEEHAHTLDNADALVRLWARSKVEQLARPTAIVVADAIDALLACGDVTRALVNVDWMVRHFEGTEDPAVHDALLRVLGHAAHLRDPNNAQSTLVEEVLRLCLPQSTGTQTTELYRILIECIDRVERLVDPAARVRAYRALDERLGRRARGALVEGAHVLILRRLAGHEHALDQDPGATLEALAMHRARHGQADPPDTKESPGEGLPGAQPHRAQAQGIAHTVRTLRALGAHEHTIHDILARGTLPARAAPTRH